MYEPGPYAESGGSRPAFEPERKNEIEAHPHSSPKSESGKAEHIDTHAWGTESLSKPDFPHDPHVSYGEKRACRPRGYTCLSWKPKGIRKRIEKATNRRVHPEGADEQKMKEKGYQIEPESLVTQVLPKSPKRSRRDSPSPEQEAKSQLKQSKQKLERQDP